MLKLTWQDEDEAEQQRERDGVEGVDDIKNGVDKMDVSGKAKESGDVATGKQS